MSKHTPGPWEVIEPDKNGQPVVSAASYEVATCWHHCVGSIEREAHANAHLIAAAPELLAALRKIEAIRAPLEPDNIWTKLDEAREVASAAIAKAEGRS